MKVLYNVKQHECRPNDVDGEYTPSGVGEIRQCEECGRLWIAHGTVKEGHPVSLGDSGWTEISKREARKRMRRKS